MSQGFRFEPTTVRHEQVVPRTRLTRLLNGRFTHRVTTVIGAAGYGKTTALALSVENNRLKPIGSDIWYSVGRSDSDPSTFLIGLATAVDLESTGDDDSTLQRIVDALWSEAPDDVAVILDDVHHIVDTESSKVLAELLQTMPKNAHLVLGSRRPLDLPVARLRAHGQLLEITESDLELDDDEADALARRTTTASSAATPLPRHVATADLQLAAGIDASADFLWEEVLSGLEPDRLTHLRRLATLDELDEDLILAVTDGQFDADSLLTGLPLVDRFDDGGRRMHAILREALTSRLAPGERRKTLAVAADAERARRHYASAVELYHESGDEISATATAREYVLTPVVFQSIDATMRVKFVADQIDNESPTAKALDAISRYSGLDHLIIPLFETAAEVARARGDTELEVAALNRIMQAMLLDHRTDIGALVERATELAKTSETAGSVAAHFRSQVFQLDGDAESAWKELGNLHDLDPARQMITHASRLCDLGRPEEVAIGHGPNSIAELPPGAELFTGLAMWQRGEAEPAVAEEIAKTMIASVLRRGFTHPSVSILGTTAIIALAAGDTPLAERRIAHAYELASSGVGASILELVSVAHAALLAVRDGDEAAAAMLDQRVQAAENWPTRGQLFSIPLLYLSRPERREMLDRCPFGPSLTIAVAAGRALVALRENDDPSPARALPWTRPNVLRAHLVPTHLVELACAAVATGNTDARAVLDATPQLLGLLDRAAEVSSPIAAGVATVILGAIPRPEPFHLHALTLGPVALLRDGDDVEVPAFTKRPKVRELFSLLLERGTMQRSEICDFLWPDHVDEERALASLRTTLSTLNDVLEPERARGSAAFHLQIDGESVGLDRRITTDLTEFEELLASAQADDDAGLPARALETYRRGAAMYRGEYLQGVDASWIVLSRLRIQTLAVSAMCRVAELTAAKGEPEEAARWAARARQIDPLNERAGRVFVSSIDATGDRSAARSAAAELRGTLNDAGLEASAQTERLLARLS